MRIINLQKNFKDFRIDIQNWTFEDGLIHGLIGPNGSGKSTLGKLLAGLIPADVREIDFGNLKPQDITISPQNPYILRDSVYKNLVYPLKLRGRAPVKEVTDRWLSLCGLKDLEKANARSLSLGQKHKLSIARSLIFEPKFVIIDESLSSLDIDYAEAFGQEILRMQNETRMTWIIISHQPAHVLKLCDQIHFIDKGRLLKSGTPNELVGQTDIPELTRFLNHEKL